MKSFLIAVPSLVLLLSCLTLANGFNEISPCSPMSHDPKCWPNPPQAINPFQCPALNYCTRVFKIISFQNGHYYCQGQGQFNCTALVKKFGMNILNKPVLVSVPQIDICHQPGACGVRSCKPYSGQPGISSLSPSCR